MLLGNRIIPVFRGWSAVPWSQKPDFSPALRDFLLKKPALQEPSLVASVFFETEVNKRKVISYDSVLFSLTHAFPTPWLVAQDTTSQTNASANQSRVKLAFLLPPLFQKFWKV